MDCKFCSLDAMFKLEIFNVRASVMERQGFYYIDVPVRDLQEGDYISTTGNIADITAILSYETSEDGCILIKRQGYPVVELAESSKVLARRVIKSH